MSNYFEAFLLVLYSIKERVVVNDVVVVVDDGFVVIVSVLCLG